MVFTVLVSWVVAIAARDRARQERAPWEGWELRLEGLRPGLAPSRQPIWWEDARRLAFSPFERWKFVKSAVSNLCRLRTPTLEDAESRWLTWNETDRSIVIDLAAMTEEDVEGPEQLKQVLDVENRHKARNQPQKPRHPAEIK